MCAFVEGEYDAAMKRLAPKLCENVRDLRLDREAAGSTDTVGVLVREDR